ncbi:MAG: malto-oligosyltrehalose trehalohydrolase [Candidatus Muiribacteriota bacterium]
MKEHTYKNIGHEFINKNTVEFCVWAPLRKKIQLHIYSPVNKIYDMKKDSFGYWKTRVNISSDEIEYKYLINQKNEFPDPASFHQPDGVHGNSKTVNYSNFNWSCSNFKNKNLKDYIIYELHIGTFTEKGTFYSAVDKIPYLKKLGINAIEIMPVNQFPGKRNWGYDGVYPFAAQNSYGGPDGLKKLVDECHKNNIAVILDVVYNHLGPEGNYLPQFAWYFTGKYSTPWGNAINYDDKYNYGVRNFVIKNALHWVKNYRIDALRLDAVHTIFDFGAKHILKELNEKIKDFSKKENRIIHLIAESDLNDTKIIDSEKKGGYGLCSQWFDDFHHALHAFFTGENKSYYLDFGKFEHILKAYVSGFVYSGNYSDFRKCNFGNSSEHINPYKLITFIQNHDQVGNRMKGDRLSTLVDVKTLKFMAAALILSPYTPMLFMGEEYGEKNPFYYFVNHNDPKLNKAVYNGRKREFKENRHKNIKIPDPASEKTFNESRLCFKDNSLLELYKKLIKVRKKYKSYISQKRSNISIKTREKTIYILYNKKNSTFKVMLDFENLEFNYEVLK